MAAARAEGIDVHGPIKDAFVEEPDPNRKQEYTGHVLTLDPRKPAYSMLGYYVAPDSIVEFYRPGEEGRPTIALYPSDFAIVASGIDDQLAGRVYSNRSSRSIAFKDGRTYFSFTHSAPILWVALGLFGSVIALLVSPYWAFRSRVNKTLLEERRLIKRREENLRDDRERIARELHDGPLNDLYHVRRALAGGIPGEAELEQYREYLRGTATAVRSIVNDLKPKDVGLVEGIEDLVRRQNALYPLVAVTFERGGRPPKECSEQHDILRIVQEALSNALKHADPTRVDVRLTNEPDRFRITVTDDGCGLAARPGAGYSGERGFGGRAVAVESGDGAVRDAALGAPGGEALMSGGHGLSGVRERAAMVGGDVRLTPGPGGKGTRFEFTLDRRPWPRRIADGVRGLR
jgi:signal transduction histidine kinase